GQVPQAFLSDLPPEAYGSHRSHIFSLPCCRNEVSHPAFSGIHNLLRTRNREARFLTSFYFLYFSVFLHKNENRISYYRSGIVHPLPDNYFPCHLPPSVS